jgi:hypothetical protein
VYTHEHRHETENRRHVSCNVYVFFSLARSLCLSLSLCYVDYSFSLLLLLYSSLLFRFLLKRTINIVLLFFFFFSFLVDLRRWNTVRFVSCISDRKVIFTIDSYCLRISHVDSHSNGQCNRCLDETYSIAKTSIIVALSTIHSMMNYIKIMSKH